MQECLPDFPALGARVVKQRQAYHAAELERKAGCKPRGNGVTAARVKQRQHTGFEWSLKNRGT